MTKIDIREEKGRFILEADGHSGYSSRGSDIVCSAVSILCFTLLNTVMEKDDKKLCITYKQKDGYFYLSFIHHEDECLKAVFYAVCNGLQMLSEQYGEYVSLRFFTNRGEIINKVMQQ